MADWASAPEGSRPLSRRRFLRGAIILTGATALLAACAPATPASKPAEKAPEKPAAPAAAVPTQAPKPATAAAISRSSASRA